MRLRQLAASTLVVTTVGLGAIAALTAFPTRLATAQPLDAQPLKGTPLPPPELFYGEAYRLTQQGFEQMQAGQLYDALQTFSEVLSIERNNRDRAQEATALANISNVYLMLGQYEQATDALQQSLAILQEAKAASVTTWRDNDLRWVEAEVLGSLGNVHTLLGQYVQAIDTYQQALAIADGGDDLNHRFVKIRLLGNLARVYRLQGQDDDALIFNQQALDLAQRTRNRGAIAFAQASLSQTYTSLGEYERAIAYSQTALTVTRQLDDRLGIAFNLSNLGLTYQLSGQPETAILFLEEALAISRASSDFASEWSILTTLGATYEQLGNLPAAELSLQQAMLLAEKLRTNIGLDANRVSLVDQQASTYGLLQTVLIAQNRSAEALAIAERGRARAFVDLLAGRVTTTEVEATTATIPPMTPDQIRQVAQAQNAYLVQYALIADDLQLAGRSPADRPTKLYIWVVSPEGDIAFRQASLEDIDLATLVAQTRGTLGVRGSRTTGAAPLEKPEVAAQRQAEQNAKLSQLHDVLIEPIKDLLPADPNQPVVFMPQDELFLVPFAALKDDNGNYLVEHHTIFTAPSIQVLQLTQNIAVPAFTPGDESLEALIVGDPNMPSVNFLQDNGTLDAFELAPLPGARQEARDISLLLRVPAMTRGNAMEAVVKQRLADAALIHLATHGLLEYGDPRETGTRDVPGAIALAPGGGDDGLLTAAEILQMELQADLVVLSACDTGRGRITGDGVIGLSRSFIAAGVPSIVVSLWAVPDAPTAELMTTFYRQLDQGQTKAQALRQAMLTTMQTHPDPKDWAAFTLIGEAN